MPGESLGDLDGSPAFDEGGDERHAEGMKIAMSARRIDAGKEVGRTIAPGGPRGP